MPTGTSGSPRPHPTRVQQLAPNSHLHLDQDLRSSWSSASKSRGSQSHGHSYMMLSTQ